MKVAALDLGTNSFLCLIAEVQSGQVTQVYDDQVRVVRLGQDVQKSKMFHPEALKRARSCLEEFSEIIQKHKPDRILAMATSAARDVSNGQELFQIGRDLKIPIEIIPGEKEAEITFQGATSHLPQDGKSRVVVDVGGGSTEFILGKNHKVELSESVDVGCVRLTEKFISAQPVPAHEQQHVTAEIQKRIQKITTEITKFNFSEVIAVAGTPSAIAAIQFGGFDEKKVDGFQLSQEKLADWVEKFSKSSVEEKISKYGLEKGRADVIYIGALLLQLSLLALKAPALIVSTKGVRYGIALEVASRP